MDRLYSSLPFLVVNIEKRTNKNKQLNRYTDRQTDRQKRYKRILDLSTRQDQEFGVL